MAEIAAVPAAPPSKLSKKLIELQIPTTQITVIKTSAKVDPVGFATLLPKTNAAATTRPATLCPINLGSGGRFFKSSHKPIKPIASAGPNTEVASKKLLTVKLEKARAKYETSVTPINIATPPRYGTALV